MEKYEQHLSIQTSSAEQNSKGNQANGKVWTALKYPDLFNWTKSQGKSNQWKSMNST